MRLFNIAIIIVLIILGVAFAVVVRDLHNQEEIVASLKDCNTSLVTKLDKCKDDVIKIESEAFFWSRSLDACERRCSQ